MTIQEFEASLAAPEPPKDLTELLRALWHDRKGDWDEAHRLAQAVPTAEGSWVHAYLHRREGDLGNARYWYSRAGRPECRTSLNDEWTRIATHLLERF